MKIAEKIKILTEAPKYDASCSASGSSRKAATDGIGNAAMNGICHSWAADGRCVSLLKILMSNDVSTESLQSIDIDEDFTNHVWQHGEIPESRLSEKELHYQELWNSFHIAIANTDRKNMDLQRQYIPILGQAPRRYWKYLVEMRS